MKSWDRLLETYISIIQENSLVYHSRETIQELLLKNFNYKASMEEINRYFEPTVEDFEEDMIRQMKNLNIRYG